MLDTSLSGGITDDNPLEMDVEIPDYSPVKSTAMNSPSYSTSTEEIHFMVGETNFIV